MELRQWKKKSVVPPQWTPFWLRKCFPLLELDHCGNNTVAVFIGQTSPRLLNTISCNLHRYYLQRDACCMALSPAESHPLYSLLKIQHWSWGLNSGRNDAGKQGISEGEARVSSVSANQKKSHLKCLMQCYRYLLDALLHSYLQWVDENIFKCIVWCFCLAQ